MITNILKFIFILGSALLITACLFTKKDDISSICQSNPELCKGLNKLTSCSYQRTFLIRARYYDKIEPNQKNTRILLDKLNDYEACLEVSLSIQFTRHIDRKALSVENFLMTQQLIQSELEGIKDTQDPHLAYYLWTHRKDSKAKRVFLVAANQKGLKDSQLLTKLAIYYSKNDPQRALVFFFRALRASQSLDEIHESVFTHIMKIYYQSKNFEQAYIWALIAKAENTEDELTINFDLILKKGLTGGRKLINNEGALQAKADLYRQQLEEGVFNIKAQQ